MPQDPLRFKYLFGSLFCFVLHFVVESIKMKKENIKRKKTAQEIQDEIFKNMSADRKIEIGTQLWQLAKTLVGDKINYGARRSKASFNRG